MGEFASKSRLGSVSAEHCSQNNANSAIQGLFSFSFSHPHVTSRLEKLMGSNLVCLTDRDYMQKLQERILEDYAESMDKRIKVREVSLHLNKSN
jgi:hypothetical protein